MTKLPKLELVEDPAKNNDYIIFRHSPGKQKNSKKNQPLKAERKKKTQRKKKTKKSKKNRSNGFFGLL